MKTRRIQVLLVLLIVVCAVTRAADCGNEPGKDTRPNFVILLADDLGYGDLGCFGHPSIATPRLDLMADEGQRWTDFYSTACVCTPSRAALMTGRFPVRNGMCSDRYRVLFSNSVGGLPRDEVTLAEALKDVGYATACIGKWHLGHLPQYLPDKQGFDYYFGIPYSNDMNRAANFPPGGRLSKGYLQAKSEYWTAPLMRGQTVIEQPAEQSTITRRYTDETVRFIKQHRDEPFFVYLAHSMPHVPLFRSREFVGKSRRGLYGDVIEEIDHSVGRVLDTLKELKLDRRTLVVFTSDNGPWLTFQQQGGSAGLLREGKGCTWEGGMREPTVFWWPETIEPGVVNDMGCTMDIFTTCIKLAGAKLPEDRVIDGLDLAPRLLDKGPSPRDTMCYYRGTKLYALRHGPYKAHFITQPAYGRGKTVAHDPPLLFHMGHDPSEKFDISKEHPEIVARLTKLAAKHLKNTPVAKSQLESRIGK
ncbi:MAG: sulfatase [Planctomycetota bacterium]|nr:sulfatase [Planctomycetota bacterium]